MHKGRIIKSLSGFYSVKSEDETYECKGRGVFRKRKITPLVGDLVSFELDENKEGYIKEIEPRINELVRPPIANVNQAIGGDRKSTRLNSSHVAISYAVFCLKKKKKTTTIHI